MIEFKKLNPKISDYGTYCHGCRNSEKQLWLVSLSWRTHEALCLDCLYELQNSLGNVLLGQEIESNKKIS